MDERYAEEAIRVLLAPDPDRPSVRLEALRMLVGLIEGTDGDWNPQCQRAERIVDIAIGQATSDRLEAMRP